ADERLGGGDGVLPGEAQAPLHRQLSGRRRPLARQRRQEKGSPTMSFQGFELPDELRMLAETVGEFVRKEIWPVEVRTPGHERHIAPAEIDKLRKKARDAGFWCLDAPERFGGGGLTVFQSVVVGEQMAKHRYSIPR